MAIEKTDVVIVGVGAAGGILAAELSKAGMKVIGLERGPRLATVETAARRRDRFRRAEMPADLPRHFRSATPRPEHATA